MEMKTLEKSMQMVENSKSGVSHICILLGSDAFLFLSEGLQSGGNSSDNPPYLFSI